MGKDDTLQQLDEVIASFDGDEKAMAGFKQSVTKWLEKKITSKNAAMTDTDATSGPVTWSKMSTTLDENSEALAKLFTLEEMDDLNRIHKIMENQGHLGRRGGGGSDTAEKIAASGKGVEKAIEAILRIKFGMLKGGGIMATGKKIKPKTMGTQARLATDDEILMRMAFDPKVAKYVLEATPLKVQNGKWFTQLQAMVSAANAVDTDIPSEEKE